MGLFDLFRSTPKKQPRKKRSYAGAASSRLLADFYPMTRSSDAELKPALRNLRNRCRELARNNEYVTRYIGLMKTNVVGGGINLQMKARNDAGDLDGPGNGIIEREWRRWCKMGSATVDGRLSFVDAQRLVVETLARDGEVLVRLVRGYRGNAHRFAIQFIEADLLDEDLNIKASNGNRIRMGVEIDDYQRPVAYHLLREHPGDHEFAERHANQHIRVAASDMLHIFMPERPHQTRGAPPLTASIVSLKMLHGYREAELVAARVAASKMGFITSPDGEGYTGDDTQDDHAPVMAANPGSFEQLPAGMDIKLFDPTHPTTAFSEFHKAILRGVAANMGISYAALASDLENVNYSSIRQGALDERDFYRSCQQFLIGHFVEPIFAAWLESAMSFAEDMPLPISRFAKFAEGAAWQPRGFSWVDPLREVRANIEAVENGLLSMQDVASNYGKDIEDIFSAVERERELAEKYNIKLAFQPFGEKRPADPIVEPDENQKVPD